MPILNTNTAYGSVSKSFHWLTALLILTLFPLGLIAENLPYDTGEQLARKAWLFSLHKTLGVTLFFVALVRILWTLTQKKPALLNPDHKAESFAAETVHWLLYISLVLVPLSGWLHHAATEGFAPIWWPFGQSLPLVPKSDSVAHFFGAWHFVLTKVLAVTLLLHIAGALKHAFIDKDNTLRRMWFGHTEMAELPNATHSKRPRTVAVIIYVVALLGASVLAFSAPTPAEVTAPLAQIDTASAAENSGNWQVQSGILEINITQFGNALSGQFEGWTAVIDFDETVQDGLSGSVEVSVDIASLRLGSVTDQAMGPDFFDVENHPTAVFTADILTLEDGQYDAVGTLTLRGAEVPVILPFSLRIEGDTAMMYGQVTTDRRDFAIGDNMPDESSVGFVVRIDVEMTAQKTAP